MKMASEKTTLHASNVNFSKVIKKSDVMTIDEKKKML
jgi:hypothetical protein